MHSENRTAGNVMPAVTMDRAVVEQSSDALKSASSGC